LRNLKHCQEAALVERQKSTIKIKSSREIVIQLNGTAGNVSRPTKETYQNEKRPTKETYIHEKRIAL